MVVERVIQGGGSGCGSEVLLFWWWCNEEEEGVEVTGFVRMMKKQGGLESEFLCVKSVSEFFIFCKLCVFSTCLFIGKNSSYP